ncbi:GL10720 [Drosophila persimilis]|uniref:GL10720 n=4 Tax=Drosophila persimilis TaxID=7234 RepID=B4GAD6_DROPE|nr:GL10720 [Drosophila persimilis]
MAKKPISSRSSKHNRQISGKRSMKNADYDGGTSSGCPFDLNRASYYICQLQDEDEENQYLIIVPEAKYRRMSVNRTCPGQELAKRKPCTPRQCSGFDTLSWASPKPAHQSSSRKTEGLSVLGSYMVPPVAAETTMSIINQHIKMSIGRKPVVELIQKNHKYCTSKKNVNSPPKMQCKPKPKPMTAMAYNRTPILRPIHETSSILAENRTVLLSKNPGSSSNQEVIVLHPPVLGFRPSKNSLCLDDVQMQLIKVQHSEPHVSPRPM